MDFKLPVFFRLPLLLLLILTTVLPTAGVEIREVEEKGRGFAFNCRIDLEQSPSNSPVTARYHDCTPSKFEHIKCSTLPGNNWKRESSYVVCDLGEGTKANCRFAFFLNAKGHIECPASNPIYCYGRVVCPPKKIVTKVIPAIIHNSDTDKSPLENSTVVRQEMHAIGTYGEAQTTSSSSSFSSTTQQPGWNSTAADIELSILATVESEWEGNTTVGLNLTMIPATRTQEGSGGSHNHQLALAMVAVMSAFFAVFGVLFYLLYIVTHSATYRVGAWEQSLPRVSTTSQQRLQQQMMMKLARDGGQKQNKISVATSTGSGVSLSTDGCGERIIRINMRRSNMPTAPCYSSVETLPIF